MRIGEVSLLTNDVVRLANFYKKLLDIHNGSDDPVHQTLIGEETMLTIYDDGSEKNNQNQNICLAFTVDDVEKEYLRVVELGAEIIEPPVARPWGAVNMSFRDPDGNVIYLRAFPKQTPERARESNAACKTNYPPGWLPNIRFVVIFANYQGKWVYCFHKYRGSFEHPGGHVEPGETPMQAARRELYEETGITDCRIMPLWDYEQIWEDGTGKNNGRVFYAEVRSLGELPESEMARIELFDSVPENYTYDSEEEMQDLKRIENMLQAWAL